MASLPPGQFASPEFYRFGLRQYANRFPSEITKMAIHISGDVAQPFTVRDELKTLSRVSQTSDFHCVTTWSYKDLRWSGYRFAEFYNRIVRVECQPDEHVKYAVLRSQDGYRVCLFLEDLLRGDVLLADQLNDSPLPVEHGAPIRLVAPSHYGYKNPKHLCGIEFLVDSHKHRPSGPKFMDHPRARVAYEERARGGPGWLFRYLYRPLIRSTARRFADAMKDRK